MSADGVALSCKNAALLMSHQRDRALSDIESEALKSHLFECLSCRNFNDQLDFLRRLASRYAGNGPPEQDEPV